MSNVFYDETQVWVITEAGTLNTGGVTVRKVQLFSASAGDMLRLTDNADNPAIKVMAGVKEDMKESDFGPKGKKLPSLKVEAISGGAQAYIHFRTDLD